MDELPLDPTTQSALGVGKMLLHHHSQRSRIDSVVNLAASVTNLLVILAIAAVVGPGISRNAAETEKNQTAILENQRLLKENAVLMQEQNEARQESMIEIRKLLSELKEYRFKGQRRETVA